MERILRVLCKKLLAITLQYFNGLPEYLPALDSSSTWQDWYPAFSAQPCAIPRLDGHTNSPRFRKMNSPSAKAAELAVWDETTKVCLDM